MSGGALDLTEIRRRGQTEAAPDPAQKLTPREHSFVVRYVAPDGEQHQETVTSRILSGDERLEVGRIAAALAATRWDTLPPSQQARTWAMAECSVALREPPEWLSRWISEDDALLFGVYEEVQAHERRYFRRDDPAGGADSQEPRVAIDPIDAPSTAQE